MNYRLDFWSKFNDVLTERGKPFNKRKPTIKHWYDISIGSSMCHLSIALINKKNKIKVLVWISDPTKKQFDALFAHKDEIEVSTSHKYEWNRNNIKKASNISTYIPGLDFEHQDNYKNLMNQTMTY